MDELVRIPRLGHDLEAAVGQDPRHALSSLARGHVVSQAPRAGARLRAGARVSLVLSRGRKR
jgi:beta-lactam-binding protein with PASTA domain